MTIVDALKEVYKALGGKDAEVADINTNAEMISAIARVLPEALKKEITA